MKATEIRDKIFAISKQLYSLSDDFAKAIDFDGIDIRYLESKFKDIENVTKHIKDQIKHRKNDR